MNYDESSIKILQGLEPVRKRPGMYIGSIDSNGLHRLIWEIVDNAIDEVLAGYANHVKVTLHEDETISVFDNGRGIPFGKHEQSGLNSIDTVYTILHAGSKFDSSAYKTAGGLHGVGASVVNALSEWMNVHVFRDHCEYEAKYINGGKIKQPATLIGTTNQHGTLVRFLPDKTIFGNIKFNNEIIKEYLREKTLLFSDLTIDYIDKVMPQNSESFCYKKGLFDFVNFINSSKQIISKVIVFSGKEKDININVGLQFVEDAPGTIISFANSIKTIDGGSHENGLKQAIYEVINTYARENNYLKGKNKKIESCDIRDLVSGVISVRVPEKNIIFEGQTKNKLLTPEVKTVVEKIVQNNMKFWFNENITDARKIIQRILIIRDTRLAIKKTQEELKQTKNIKFKKYSLGKLTPCQSMNTTINEIFLVEGESAGGSAKLGRNRTYQAILPLRGKVINAEKASLHELLKNDEINSMVSCLGTGIGKEFDVNKLRYGKIIIMTDADTDGAHIQILLLTFFYRYMRKLLEERKIFIALPPLYKIVKSDYKQFAYAWTDEQLIQLQNKYGNSVIQRYKGLGEMNPQQLWETTMDPYRRKLINVFIQNTELTEQEITVLMSNKTDERKKWINQNIDFEMEN